MKIIGKTNTGFIIEALRTEIQELDDKYYGERSYEVGSVITVDKMYDQVKFLSRHRDEIKTVQKNFKESMTT